MAEENQNTNSPEPDNSNDSPQLTPQAADAVKNIVKESLKEFVSEREEEERNKPKRTNHKPGFLESLFGQGGF